jgi:hypothetical protein
LEIIDWEWSEEWQQWIPIYGWVYDGSQTMHYWFYGEISAEDPKDDHLFGHTIGSYSRQHFTFVWTCASANNMTDPNTGYQCYGFIDNENNTGEVGWPYAWTARSDLHRDGYSDPDSSDYCYIGFKGSSKPLMEGINETDYYYFSFINLFYTRLTLNYYQYTVKQSLDYASQMIWDQPWWNTTLAIGYTDEQTGEYCWMNVFGNSNLYLP